MPQKEGRKTDQAGCGGSDKDGTRGGEVAGENQKTAEARVEGVKCVEHYPQLQ